MIWILMFLVMSKNVYGNKEKHVADLSWKEPYKAKVLMFSCNNSCESYTF